MTEGGTGNLYDFPAHGGNGAPEAVDVLVASAVVRVERIVSRGHASAPGFWYDQNEHEWVAVIEGEARLSLRDPDESVELRRGDHLFIEAHRRHRVEWTTPEQATVWLAVFYSSAVTSSGS